MLVPITIQVDVPDGPVGSWAGDALPGVFADEGEFCDWLNTHPRAWGGTFEDVIRRPWTHRSSATFGMSDIYETLVCTEEPHLSGHIDELTRYFFEGEFAGEHMGTHALDGYEARLFSLGTDFTKSRRDDWGFSLPNLWTILREGTPVRKTNKAGPGTKGTRKVEGISGRYWLAFR